jgi:hypothetical protein
MGFKHSKAKEEAPARQVRRRFEGRKRVSNYVSFEWSGIENATETGSSPTESCYVPSTDVLVLRFT